MISSSVVYGHPVKYSYQIPDEFLSESMTRCCNIFGQFYLRKSYFFTLFQNNVSKYHNSYFFGAALSSVQLLFLRSSFFQNSHFFSALFFSEQLLFQSENSTEKSHLENRKFFSAVTFRNSYPQNISTEELLFRIIGSSAQHQIFQKISKAIFLLTYFFLRATFLKLLS